MLSSGSTSPPTTRAVAAHSSARHERKAIQLYERLGFSSRGVRRGCYTDSEDALIMEGRSPATVIEHR
jgi:ribosomal protein S18 acetylase RimI-like enzyme